jgi:hypothetical protein
MSGPDKKQNYFEHEQLGNAIRWLREQRRDWTRQQLVDTVKKECEISFSTIYLTKLERAERTSIAHVKLSALLKALGSNQDELTALFEQKPWEHQTSTRRRTGTSIDQTIYQQAAVDALAELTAAGTWSSGVEDPTEQSRLQGQAVELVEHFVKLSSHERTEIINQVRARRMGKNSD